MSSNCSHSFTFSCQTCLRFLSSPVCVCARVCVCVCVCVCVWTYLSVCLCVCLSVWLSVHPSTHLLLCERDLITTDLLNHNVNAVHSMNDDRCNINSCIPFLTLVGNLLLINYEFTTTYSHMSNVTTLVFTVFDRSASSLHTETIDARRSIVYLHTEVSFLIFTQLICKWYKWWELKWCERGVF
jgi:hypothetical protein